MGCGLSATTRVQIPTPPKEEGKKERWDNCPPLSSMIPPLPPSVITRNKQELQASIQQYKETNATLTAINKELEAALFKVLHLLFHLWVLTSFPLPPPTHTHTTPSSSFPTELTYSRSSNSCKSNDPQHNHSSKDLFLFVCFLFFDTNDNCIATLTPLPFPLTQAWHSICSSTPHVHNTFITTVAYVHFSSPPTLYPTWGVIHTPHPVPLFWWHEVCDR